MKKSMILLLLVLTQMQGAAQQKEWTLSDCINYALEHNISVRQSELNVEQREIDLNTAQGRRLPGLSASSSESLSFGRGLGADNTYTNSNTSSTSNTFFMIYFCNSIFIIIYCRVSTYFLTYFTFFTF